ncbi:unnamed protein product [Didymodactylos carnosus]|uniref:Uncharacterized protein n=1 Tax=Didymodactylos carnosus TaxID=1234261 RepID=A0A814YCQ3_9BILA|nr:unnamed protein product [Didymodactylos carnosus]CAF3990040.1 unnamed protein product [Didymodactylos carnosus]
MARFEYGNYDLRQTSNFVNVPDHPVAKCMYYLDVVLDLVEYEESNLNKLRDYSNYDDLSAQEIRLLYVLCAALSPDELINKCMFQNDTLCGNSTNRIYELGHTQNHLVVANSILIAGRNRRVKCFMTFKQIWLLRNYIQPMLEMPNEIQKQAQIEATAEQLSQACTIS